MPPNGRPLRAGPRDEALSALPIFERVRQSSNGKRGGNGGMDLESMRHVYLRRIVAPLCGALGFEATHFLARKLAARVRELDPPGRRRAAGRIASAIPGASVTRVESLVEQLYDHQGRFWAEALFARRLLRDRSWRRFVDVRDEDALRFHAASGCILTTAYFGNPAVAALALGQILRPVYVIVDVFREPTLRGWQRELYSHPWIRPIERRDASAVVPSILRGGGAVLMIAEHERKRGRAVEVDFLGSRLRCYPTLGRLSRWFDVPVAVVTCRRLETPFRFELNLHDTFRFRSGGQDEAEIVAGVMATLENAILGSDPGQYLWSVETGRSAQERSLSAGRIRSIATETEIETAMCQTIH